MYKLCFLFLLTLCLCFYVCAQQTGEILATSSVKTFTIQDLPGETQKIWAARDATVATLRKQLAEQMLSDTLIQNEARVKNVTPESLIAAQKAKIAAPSEAQIKTIYDANRTALADHTPEEARKEIINFLRHDAEEAALNAYSEGLALKYKVLTGKDINAPGLKPADVLFTAGGTAVTVREFEDKYRLFLHDTRSEIADRVVDDLEETIYSTLVLEEAKAQNTDAPSIIAREISGKMRAFSDTERAELVDAFRKRLYTKYNVKVLFTGPAPIVQNISPDDDPSRGPPTAPVTIVMFSDFQCPACAATHPVLTQVLSEYGNKVRLVVRDFPLMSIHENAFDAARAANAANAQGKFFEYVEILYAHQDALDAASLRKYAAELGLNGKQFNIDLSAEKTAAELQKDIADGRAYGVNGTPTIFVNGVKVRRLSAAAFRKAIDAALAKI